MINSNMKITSSVIHTPKNTTPKQKAKKVDPQVTDKVTTSNYRYSSSGNYKLKKFMKKATAAVLGTAGAVGGAIGGFAAGGATALVAAPVLGITGAVTGAVAGLALGSVGPGSEGLGGIGKAMAYSVIGAVGGGIGGAVAGATAGAAAPIIGGVTGAIAGGVGGLTLSTANISFG